VKATLRNSLSAAILEMKRNNVSHALGFIPFFIWGLKWLALLLNCESPFPPSFGDTQYRQDQANKREQFGMHN